MKTDACNRWWLGVLCFLLAVGLVSAADQAAETAARITAEATAPNDGPDGRPLPLASHWCSGSHPFSAGWQLPMQLERIGQGEPILPWMAHPVAASKPFTEEQEASIRRLAELRLPLVLISSQWERLLSGPPYKELPPDQNPNVVTTDGKVLAKVSPFGPVEPWREVGRTYSDNDPMRRLQEQYPNPPVVFFLSNNEHGKLRWHEAETSSRYMARYGEGQSDTFKRQVIAEGWIERYRALQEGMRGGLTPAWQQTARFIAYNAFGLEFIGRWGGWKNYCLTTDKWIDPDPLMWDGGSPSYYLHSWNPTTDYTTWSPQIEFMNDVFQQREAWRLNPRFWIELSIWDGHDHAGHRPAPANDKRRFYMHQGQDWTPARYAGFVQFGMWLLRPRALREYRGWTFRYEEGKPWFGAIVEAAERVWRSPELTAYWRHGELVANPAHEHPWGVGIPERYRDEPRWFLLDCDKNPGEYPWETFWQVKVYAEALVLGEAPRRRWLIYAFAPRGDVQDAAVTVPGQPPVKLTATVDGAYFELDETTGTLRRLDVSSIDIPTPEPGECLRENAP